LNTTEIDDLIIKIEDTLGNEGTAFTQREQDLMIDALVFYKEMQVI